MKVPFLDLSRDAALLPMEDILEDIRAIAGAGVFIGGDPVDRFEKAFAAYCGTTHAVGCGNGLDALFLSLRSLNIGPGDEVIVPAHTYFASWLAVTQAGATLVPVDARADTGCIDPDLIEAAVTPQTRAVMVVHLYGHVPDMDRIDTIAGRHGLTVIEDAAQAHGATHGGARAGTFGKMAGFSFYPTKNLGAWGDAGAVTTDDPDLAARVRRLRDYGRTSAVEFGEAGINSRLDPVQAAVLMRKLPLLDSANARRGRIAQHYDAAIESGNRIKRLLRPGAESIWHQYIVVVEDRDDFRRFLEDAGIGTGIHYPIPPYRQQGYRHLNLDGNRWPVAEYLADHIVSLPVGSYLEDEEIAHVCHHLSRYG